eukprot:m.24022 g.24022  ORF g.24022 m.24022 type:complete len:168 (+) comp28562_c0_seq2:961-1464(+)
MPKLALHAKYTGVCVVLPHYQRHHSKPTSRKYLRLTLSSRLLTHHATGHPCPKSSITSSVIRGRLQWFHPNFSLNHQNKVFLFQKRQICINFSLEFFNRTGLYTSFDRSSSNAACSIVTVPNGCIQSIRAKKSRNLINARGEDFDTFSGLCDRVTCNMFGVHVLSAH